MIINSPWNLPCVTFGSSSTARSLAIILAVGLRSHVPSLSQLSCGSGYSCTCFLPVFGVE